MKKFKQVFDETYFHGPKWKWKTKRVFKFTWDYCPTCDAMYVLCPKCGNHCCNGGFGRTTKDGKPTKKFQGKDIKDCDVCNLAYMYEHLAYHTGTTPKHE